MYQVVKRDGRQVDFDLSRIASAIQKAFEATKMPYDKDIIRMLTLQVTADVAPKVTNDRINVEEIQDSVEAVSSVRGTPRSPKPTFSTERTAKSCGKFARRYSTTKNLWTII